MTHYTDATWLITQLFIQQLVQNNNKNTYKTTHHYFLRGIHWWTMNSPHQRPVIQKTFLCHDVIMTLYGFFPGTGYKSLPHKCWVFDRASDLTVSSCSLWFPDRFLMARWGDGWSPWKLRKWDTWWQLIAGAMILGDDPDTLAITVMP